MANTTTFLPLMMLLSVLVGVLMVDTARANPQFGSPVIVQTLPRGASKGGVPRRCNPSCPRIYIPVCGTDGKTYGNMCVLKFFECAYRNVTVAYPRACSIGGGNRGGYPVECPTLCYGIYEPVCGSDGRTYSNICFLQAVACKNPNRGLTLQYDGECGTQTQQPCPAICPAIYNPVCGSDGQTYSNQCVLESNACNNPSLVTVSQGECPSNQLPDQFPVDTPTRRIPSFLPAQPPSFDLYPNRGSCPNNCERDFNPVCANDGKTYYNRCIMNLMACRERRSITVSYVGRCDGAGGIVAN